MNLPSLLEQCNTLAAEAGRAVMAVYETDFEVITKSDHSPLTQADLASHRIITQGLSALEPAMPCLSEEAADIGWAQRCQWQRYWLIDPLDGTREFVKRNDEFTVNIALIEDGQPILGVVLAPVLNTTYLAARSVGAWRERDGVRDAIHVRFVPAKPTLLASKSHRDAQLDTMLAGLPEHELIGRGSSLKFCTVAEGGADCYPRTGPTSEWDTAAGQCVVEQAGGQVLRLPDWQPLDYNHKASLLNPGFVVIGDSGYGWRHKLEATTTA